MTDNYMACFKCSQCGFELTEPLSRAYMFHGCLRDKTVKSKTDPPTWPLFVLDWEGRRFATDGADLNTADPPEAPAA